MKKIPYAEKLKDPRWQRKRLEVMQRDCFQCQTCGSVEKTLHVHHCHYEKGDPWNAPASMMTTLCEECHVQKQKDDESLKRLFGVMLTKVNGQFMYEALSNSINSIVDCDIPVVVSYSDLQDLASSIIFRGSSGSDDIIRHIMKKCDNQLDHKNGGA